MFNILFLEQSHIKVFTVWIKQGKRMRPPPQWDSEDTDTVTYLLFEHFFCTVTHFGFKVIPLSCCVNISGSWFCLVFVVYSFVLVTPNMMTLWPIFCFLSLRPVFLEVCLLKTFMHFGKAHFDVFSSECCTARSCSLGLTFWSSNLDLTR